MFFRKKVRVEDYLLDELKMCLGIDSDVDAVEEAVRRTIDQEEALWLLAEAEKFGLGPEAWEEDPDAWRRGD